MIFFKKNIIWIICIFSFFTAIFYSQLNLSKLPKENKRENTIVKTNDEFSYINPAETYHKTGVWKQNGNTTQSYFLRPPGYGVFYLIFYKLTNRPLFYLKIAQHLLFSFSVYWFFCIIFLLINKKNIALFVAALYGLAPFFIGFLSYGLTEGITPAFLLLFVYLLFKANSKTVPNKKTLFYFLAALSFAIILIVRPALGFMGMLLPIFIIKDYWSKGALKIVLKLIVFGMVAFSFIAMWQYRNYKITDQYVGLHAIYFADNNSIYRPTFKEYWNFIGGWAQRGEVAHSYMVPMWEAAIKGDSSEVYVKNALKTFPKEVITHFGTERLKTVFKKYQTATLSQKYYYENNLPMPLTTPVIEQEVIKEFKQLTKEFKHEFWFQYHIVSPLKVFKTMAFHSNLSLYIFQKTYRGTWLVEITRYLFYALHVLCFLGLFISLILFKTNNWKTTALLFTVFSYVLYLCYFQRGIEERYTLPVLPLLMIGLTTLLNYCYYKYYLECRRKLK